MAVASVMAAGVGYVFVRHSLTMAIALALLPPLVWLIIRPFGGLTLGVIMILTLPSWQTLGSAQFGVARLASVAVAISFLLAGGVRPRWPDCTLALLLAIIVLGWLLQYDEPHVGRFVQGMLTPVGFYLGARALPVERLPSLLVTVLFAGTVGALTVLLEYSAGHLIFIPTSDWIGPHEIFRPGGIFGSPPSASTAMCVVILFGVAGLRYVRGATKTLAIISLFICTLALIATFTRAALIAGAVGLVVFLWLARSPLLRPIRLAWCAAVLAGLVLLVLPSLEKNSTFEQGIVRPGTFAARESYWQLAVPVATASTHNFVFGIGTGALETAGRFIDDPTQSEVAVTPQAFEISLHNEYVTMLVEQGVVGLGALALFLISIFVPVARAARARTDPALAAVAAAIVAVAIVMTVDTAFFDTPSFAIIMLTAGIAVAVGGSGVRPRHKLRSGPRLDSASVSGTTVSALPV